MKLKHREHIAVKVKLKFFGQLRDLAKIDEENFEIKEDAQISELLSSLGEHIPAIREHLKVTTCAINNEYVSKDAVLQEGNEVALLPPISGG